MTSPARDERDAPLEPESLGAGPQYPMAPDGLDAYFFCYQAARTRKGRPSSWAPFTASIAV